jgi:hypothetical protein
MSIRKHKRELARWETATRQWAADAGRRLAIDLHRGHEVPIQPYTVGVVLWTSRNEHVWGQVPARCSADTPITVRAGQPRRGDPPPQPRITDWLITSHRIAGRLYPDTLRWWEWTTIVGLQVDLTAGFEYVQLDLPLPAHPVRWYGPGVAPLAVAAVYHLYGPTAVLDHPGLAQLRNASSGTIWGDESRGLVVVGELESPRPQDPLL